MNRKRLLHATVLVAGLLGIGFVVNRTMNDAQHEVMPSAVAIGIAAALTLVAVFAGGRAWAALFGDVLDDRIARQVMAGTYYSSQLTKYLPAGGAVQAASQVSLATATGMPLGRVALAFPVLSVTAVVAGVTLGAGLALASELSVWMRVLALSAVAAPTLLDRRLLSGVLGISRRLVRRIPSPERLPSQRNIVSCYLWLLVNLGGYSAAYAVLVRSLSREVNPAVVFCAFAVGWVIGYLVLPAPAGVGIREAAIVAIVPGLGAALLLAASLVHRLLSIGAELVTVLGNGLASRWARRSRGSGGIPVVGVAAKRTESARQSIDPRDAGE